MSHPLGRAMNQRPPVINCERRGQRGSILVLVALSMTMLLGVAALSIDASFMYDKRNKLYAAADAAAKAGAIEVRRNSGISTPNLKNFADRQVASHGLTAGACGTTTVGTSSVCVNHPPTSGPFNGINAYVEVIVSETNSTFFGNVLGLGSMRPGARAVAGTSAGTGCIITFDDVTMGNNNVVNMPNCGMSVGDDVSLGNGTTITSLGTSVTGTCSGCGGVTNLRTGTPPPSDPLASLQPPADPGGTCTTPLNITTAMTISATQHFCGWEFNGGSLTLNPGIYYLTGPITARTPGKDVVITGSNVMIYLAPGAYIDLDSNHVVMDLHGRTVAPYNGILFYQDRANTHTADFAKNNGDFTFEGALYFPSAGLTVKNNAGFGSDCTLFISSDLTLKNNGTISNACGSFGGTPLLTLSLSE